MSNNEFYDKHTLIYFTKNHNKIYDDEGDCLVSTYGWDGKYIYDRTLFKAVRLCRFEVDDPYDYYEDDGCCCINLCEIAEQNKGSRAMILRNEKKQSIEWANLCKEKGWEGGEHSIYTAYKKYKV